MTVDDFNTWDAVRFVPNHASGDPNHEACENGVVYSKNDKTVFVKYIRNNILCGTPAGTNPDDLMKGHW